MLDIDKYNNIIRDNQIKGSYNGEEDNGTVTGNTSPAVRVAMVTSFFTNQTHLSYKTPDIVKELTRDLTFYEMSIKLCTNIIMFSLSFNISYSETFVINILVIKIFYFYF